MATITFFSLLDAAALMRVLGELYSVISYSPVNLCR